MVVIIDAAPRDFIQNALDSKLYSIPGVGLREIEVLERSNITHTDELVAQFFFLRRDEDQFVQYLQDLGIDRSPANDIAREIGKKFRGL